MTKVSEARSALRRLVLTKAAAAAGNELSAIYAGIAAHHKSGIPQGGYEMGAAAMARRPVARKAPAKAPAPKPAPAVVSDRPLFPKREFTHYQAPRDYQGAGVIDAAEHVVNGADWIRRRMLGAVRPVLSGIARPFAGRGGR